MEYVETSFADTGATGGTDLVMAAPAAVADGAFLLMQIAARGGSGVTVPTLADWTNMRNVNNGTVTRHATSYKFVTDATLEPASYTVTLSTAEQALGAVSMWTGLKAFDVFSNGIGSVTSATPAAGSILATSVNELVLAPFAHGSGDANGDVYGPLPPIDMTEIYQMQSPAALDTDRVAMALYAMNTVVSGATGSKTATASVSAAWHAHQLGCTPLVLETEPTLRHTYFGQRRNP